MTKNIDFFRQLSLCLLFLGGMVLSSLAAHARTTGDADTHKAVLLNAMSEDMMALFVNYRSRVHNLGALAYCGESELMNKISEQGLVSGEIYDHFMGLYEAGTFATEEDALKSAATFAMFTTGYSNGVVWGYNLTEKYFQENEKETLCAAAKQTALDDLQKESGSRGDWHKGYFERIEPVLASLFLDNYVSFSELSTLRECNKELEERYWDFLNLEEKIATAVRSNETIAALSNDEVKKYEYMVATYFMGNGVALSSIYSGLYGQDFCEITEAEVIKYMQSKDNNQEQTK